MKLQLLASAALVLLNTVPSVVAEESSSAISKPIALKGVFDAVSYEAADLDEFDAEDAEVDKDTKKSTRKKSTRKRQVNRRKRKARRRGMCGVNMRSKDKKVCKEIRSDFCDTKKERKANRKLCRQIGFPTVAEGAEEDAIETYAADDEVFSEDTILTAEMIVEEMMDELGVEDDSEDYEDEDSEDDYDDEDSEDYDSEDAELVDRRTRGEIRRDARRGARRRGIDRSDRRSFRQNVRRRCNGSSRCRSVRRNRNCRGRNCDESADDVDAQDVMTKDYDDEDSEDYYDEDSEDYYDEDSEDAELVDRRTRGEIRRGARRRGIDRSDRRSVRRNVRRRCNGSSGCRSARRSINQRRFRNCRGRNCDESADDVDSQDVVVLAE